MASFTPSPLSRASRNPTAEQIAAGPSGTHTGSTSSTASRSVRTPASRAAPVTSASSGVPSKSSGAPQSVAERTGFTGAAATAISSVRGSTPSPASSAATQELTPSPRKETGRGARGSSDSTETGGMSRGRLLLAGGATLLVLGGVGFLIYRKRQAS